MAAIKVIGVDIARDCYVDGGRVTNTHAVGRIGDQGLNLIVHDILQYFRTAIVHAKG